VAVVAAERGREHPRRRVLQLHDLGERALADDLDLVAIEDRCLAVAAKCRERRLELNKLEAQLALVGGDFAHDGDANRATLDFGVFDRKAERLQQRAGQATRLTATRDGSTLEFELVPERYVENGREVGRIGLGATLSGDVAFPPDMLTVERYGPFAAIAPAIAETWEKSSLTMRFLWRMVTGDVSTKNISGPINIAQYAGLTATEGFTYYLGFLALVSISLAVLNLLPVPVLDGGLLEVGEVGRPLDDGGWRRRPGLHRGEPARGVVLDEAHRVSHLTPPGRAAPLGRPASLARPFVRSVKYGGAEGAVVTNVTTSALHSAVERRTGSVWV
jgi:hypothetical protein